MKKLMILTCAAAAALLVSGCADDYGYRYGYGYGGYAVIEPYDVWYDGFYGPYVGGYWDRDIFIYRSPSGGFVRDDAGHFRHERFARAHRFRSAQQAAAGATAPMPPRGHPPR